MIDPSNRQSVEEQNRRLKEQYSELAELAGALAHEIKNPLSTIRLNMELLAEDIAEPQTPKEMRMRRRIEIVERESRRLNELLDDYLNFTKVRQYRLEPTDLNRVIEELLDFYAPQAEANSIRVSRFLAPNLPLVMLDIESFKSALWNLVINAQQAMSEGGELVVRTFEVGASVALQLIDTGCGMDEKTASQIFTAFYSTKPGGSGLGLSTTAKIIESHGGRIDLVSELGRGTQVIVNLPVPTRLPGATSGESHPASESK